MCSEKVNNMFKIRYYEAVKCIIASNIPMQEFGVFGSFARGDFKATSDIDFVIITECIDRSLIANLRCKLDELNCDLAIIKPDNFYVPKTTFNKEVKSSYRRCFNE